METVLNVAFPVFAVTLCGYLAGRFGVLGPASSEALNRFVFYFGLPPLFFISMARVPVAEVLNWPFIGAFCVATAATAAIACAGGRLIFGVRGAPLSLHGLSAVFGNTGYMGIPIFIAAFGPEGALPAIVSTVIGAALVLGISLIFLELGRIEGAPVARLGETFRAVLLNPLLLAPVAGLLVSALGITVPVPIARLCDLLGAAAAPGALFAMGMFLVGCPVAAGLGEVSWLVVMKLAVQPLLTWWLVTAVFPVEPFWAASAVVLAGLPTATLVFVLAQQYGVYTQRSSSVILISTVISVVTVSASMLLLA